MHLKKMTKTIEKEVREYFAIDTYKKDEYMLTQFDLDAFACDLGREIVKVEKPQSETTTDKIKYTSEFVLLSRVEFFKFYNLLRAAQHKVNNHEYNRLLNELKSRVKKFE